MKQSKKLFRRMLMNNWGGISHKILEFHEYVNLFSGKSGSGKSTVMDAIQVILYGSVSAAFLNKAADDAKNRRSVLSYLRGAQKDGTANREHVDFCSQIVLEIEDTGSGLTICIGAVFEVGRHDRELRKYHFFSHSGKIPENGYVTEDGTPYTTAQLKKLIELRSGSEENRGRLEVNRIYPSREAYLNTLYDVIFGYIDPGRLVTMEKSAIALRMADGTGQFIRDYMFPKSKEDTVSAISRQLGAYREIKERVDDLERRIEILTGIREENRKLIQVKADRLRAERILRIADISADIFILCPCTQSIQNLPPLSGIALKKTNGGLYLLHFLLLHTIVACLKLRLDLNQFICLFFPAGFKGIVFLIQFGNLPADSVQILSLRFQPYLTALNIQNP